MGSNQQVRKGFNQISGYYNLLQRMVFANTLRNAEAKSIHLLQNCSTVMVIGGGSGFFLEQLVKLGIPNILYIELSDKMIEMAKRRVERLNKSTTKVIYINKGWEEYMPDEPVDAIVCNFFLDVFHERTIQKIIFHYNRHIKNNGLWYCTDFYIHTNSGILYSSLIKFMYWFFQAICNIEAKRLPDIFPYFGTENFETVICWKSEYLQQSVYKKK